jgi:hypothetical protein
MTAEVAWASTRTKASYFHAEYHRLARRRGRNKAATAVAPTILVAICHMIRTGQPYNDIEDLFPIWLHLRDAGFALIAGQPANGG